MKNQVTLITGGAGRIGSSFSKAIVRNSGKVIIGDISEDRGMRLQQELGAKNALFVEVDITDVDSIKETIKLGKNEFGKIDSAVHCAYPTSPGWGRCLEEIQPEDFTYQKIDSAFYRMILKNHNLELHDQTYTSLKWLDRKDPIFIENLYTEFLDTLLKISNNNYK